MTTPAKTAEDHLRAVLALIGTKAYRTSEELDVLLEAEAFLAAERIVEEPPGEWTVIAREGRRALWK